MTRRICGRVRWPGIRGMTGFAVLSARETRNGIHKRGGRNVPSGRAWDCLAAFQRMTRAGFREAYVAHAVLNPRFAEWLLTVANRLSRREWAMAAAAQEALKGNCCRPYEETPS